MKKNLLFALIISTTIIGCNNPEESIITIDTHIDINFDKLMDLDINNYSNEELIGIVKLNLEFSKDEFNCCPDDKTVPEASVQVMV